VATQDCQESLLGCSKYRIHPARRDEPASADLFGTHGLIAESTI
jgi:hypothetical protein